jgi:hypothetical protein
MAFKAFRDTSRLLQFIQADVLQSGRFQAIILRYQLDDAWQKFARQFLSDAP